MTRHQPSGEAESGSNVKFSGSERLADDWWEKKVCAPVQDKLTGREREGGEINKKRERGE